MTGLERSLTDDNVTVKPFDTSDEEGLLEGRDSEFDRFLGDASAEPAPAGCIWVADTIVGWVDFDNDDRHWLADDEVNVGYNIFPQHRGKGYGTRALRLLCGFLLAQRPPVQPTLLIHPENTPSQTLATRAGFAPVGEADGELLYKLENTLDPRAVLAAENNADWYEMMFAVHGLRYERSKSAFLAIDQPPAYHSRMLILDPTPGPELVAQVATEGTRLGFRAKDGFCCLDLEAVGLVEFFTADWIWSTGNFETDTTGWDRITDPADLAVWDRAWANGGSPTTSRQFPEPILTRDDVAIWGRRSGGGFDAGAIANLSFGDDGQVTCVGLSNVFGSNAMAAARTLCARFADGAPVVGFEHGDALTEALAAGFEPVGQLRICGRPDRSVGPG